jgi:hypothetical protein
VGGTGVQGAVQVGFSGWNGAARVRDAALSNVAGTCCHDACGVPVLQQLAEEQIADYALS